MNWACEFSGEAKEDLRGLPKAIQKRVARVIAQMAADPFQGNVKALQVRGMERCFPPADGRLPAPLYRRSQQEALCRPADLASVRQDISIIRRRRRRCHCI